MELSSQQVNVNQPILSFFDIKVFSGRTLFIVCCQIPDMASPSELYRKGLALAMLTALISGVSVFVNGEAVKLADPSVYTLLKNAGSLLFLGAMVLAFNEWHRFRSLTRRQWGLLALVGIIGGGAPFLMFFTGLAMGGAAASSFIYRSLFVFAGVAGWLFLKERPEPKDVAAGFLILAGNAFLVSGGISFGTGTMLVLGATVLWALEYALSRRLLSSIHPRVVMSCRMLFGSALLFAALGATGSLGQAASISSGALLWLIATSALLAVFMLSWYTALKYLPLLKATSILALGGIVTAVLDLAFSSNAPAPADALGLTLILAGAVAMAGVSELLRSAASLKEAVPEMVG